jgi:uncharacterized protein YxjI
VSDQQRTERRTAAVPYVLELRQRFTVVQNRYDLVRQDAAGETPLAYAEQKRFALREQVTFLDADGRDVAFTLRARNVVELVGTYDIADGSGALLGTLRKDALSSLARSTYRLQTPSLELVGVERTWWRPLTRRVLNVVADAPWVLPLQFDFAPEGGPPAFSVERRLKVRDVYRVDVRDDRIDWRVAAACAVAVDAFMNR